MDKNTKTKLYISACLSEIKDKSLENILREIIFSNNINYQKAQESIINNRPETKSIF